MQDAYEHRMEVVQLARGTRMVAGVIVLAAGALNGWTGLLTSGAREVFNDMLGGKPLPGLTQLVLGVQPLHLPLAGLLGLGALASLIAVRRHDVALGAAAVFLGVALFQVLAVWTAMLLPVLAIFTTIGRAP